MAEHVLDTNVFIHGAELALRFEDPITVPAVTEEVKSSAAGRRFDLTGIDIYAPSDAAVHDVEDATATTGDTLSETDIAVIALAYDREAVVVSDDYGVQNVAEHLEVDYEGFMQDGISGQREWVTVCTGCGRIVETGVKQCPRCGAETKRKPD